MTVNRNKRSVALDLKSDGGKAALWRLIDGADVLVENFSPGTFARLGFGAEATRSRNPRLVYAAISGFGQSGPDHDRVAYDLIVQGMSGMMSVTGHPDGPPTRLGVPIADIGAGMFAAYAIAAALFRRAQTGEGCTIDTSMLGGQLALLTYQASGFLATGEVPAARQRPPDDRPLRHLCLRRRLRQHRRRQRRDVAPLLRRRSTDPTSPRTRHSPPTPAG
jgi:crotonobetainyl-CoA:carnitine CoA-transferase CaiB-like acyl-CoA transferase